MNHAVVSLSSLSSSGRLDAKYNIALSHNRVRVESLLRRNNRADLDRIAARVGQSELAWECISKGKTSTNCPKLLPRTCTDEEVGLYIIVATFDDSVTEELQALLKTVAQKRKIVSFRGKIKEFT